MYVKLNKIFFVFSIIALVLFAVGLNVYSNILLQQQLQKQTSTTNISVDITLEEWLKRAGESEFKLIGVKHGDLLLYNFINLLVWNLRSDATVKTTNPLTYASSSNSAYDAGYAYGIYGSSTTLTPVYSDYALTSGAVAFTTSYVKYWGGNGYNNSTIVITGTYTASATTLIASVQLVKTVMFDYARNILIAEDNLPIAVTLNQYDALVIVYKIVITIP